MPDKNEDYGRIWEDRGNKAFGFFTRHPIIATFLTFVAIGCTGLVLQFTVGAFNFIGDWGSQPARIASVDNVRRTWREAYRLDRSLTAQARIVCRTAQAGGLADTISGSPLLATQTRYDNIQAGYSELVSNKLEGGLVLPPDLHAIDETLNERLRDREVGCPQRVIEQISGGLR